MLSLAQSRATMNPTTAWGMGARHGVYKCRHMTVSFNLGDYIR